MIRSGMKAGLAILCTALAGGSGSCGSHEEPGESEAPPVELSPAFKECLRSNSVGPQDGTVLTPREIAARVATVSIQCEPSEAELNAYGQALGGQ